MEKQISILYVDDESINLELFSLVLKKKFNVITAESGNEGLEKLRGNRDISVVISDMKMPGMNGVEFISKARKNFENIVYYILTGFEITEEIAETLNKRLINKYLKNPFNSKEIETSISENI